MKISVRIDGMSALQARISGMGKQIPFAASVAINRTAKAVEDAERKAISGGTFDRPKPQTAKATYVKRSTKQNLTAEIGIKSRAMGIPADEYLHANIKGGARSYKRSELMLKQAGILPAGMFTVPGAGASLDAFGNMSRGQIVSILSFFRTFGNTKLNSKRMNITERTMKARTRSKTDYFVVPVASRELKLFPGIWQRTGEDAIKPVLMFVSRAKYRAIYNFEEIAVKVVRARFAGEFDTALKQALASAR